MKSAIQKMDYRKSFRGEHRKTIAVNQHVVRTRDDDVPAIRYNEVIGMSGFWRVGTSKLQFVK